MEKSYRIDHVEKKLSVAKDDAGLHITVDGKQYTVTDASVVDGVLTFFIGSRTYRAAVSKSPDGTRITLDGRLFLVHGDAEEGVSAGAAHHGDGSVEAPMPGSIVAVHVEAGDEVNAGDSILTLESMKMQNAVTASVSGTVSVVHCAVGDQVAFGDVLAVVIPAG